MKDQAPISEQLREAVRQSELTRYRIAQETGIAASILCRFVNDGAGLSLESIDKLCDCLGLRLTSAKPGKQSRKGK